MNGVMTLDELIEQATEARRKSPLGGKTVVVLSEPEIEYCEFQRTYLDVDRDGAVFCVCLDGDRKYVGL